jgi:hypothetical protein
MGAHIRAMCTNLYGPLESPTRESCEGGVLQSFRKEMRCFHNLLRHKPSSLFTLLGWSSITIAPWWYDLYIWVWWRGCWCHGAECDAPSWCCAPSQLTCLNVLAQYADGAPSTWSQSVCLYKADLAALTGDTVYPQCPQSLVILDQPKESTVFLRRSPNNLMCQDSNLLM